jgi:hypothetical protein
MFQAALTVYYRLLAALEERGPIGQADLGRSTSVDRSDVVTARAERAPSDDETAA